MHRTLEFAPPSWIRIVARWVFAEQPRGCRSPPCRLLARGGALAGTAPLSFFASLFYVMFAAVQRFHLYQLGRRKGSKILQLLLQDFAERFLRSAARGPFFESRAPARLVCWPSFSLVWAPSRLPLPASSHASRRSSSSMPWAALLGRHFSWASVMSSAVRSSV